MQFTQPTFEQAVERMSNHFQTMDAEKRSYICNHFIAHCQQANIPLSASFIRAFNIAAAPWKDR